jgi:hypothetical protein
MTLLTSVTSKSEAVKITKIEDLHCNAGWCDFAFLKFSGAAFSRRWSTSPSTTSPGAHSRSGSAPGTASRSRQPASHTGARSPASMASAHRASMGRHHATLGPSSVALRATEQPIDTGTAAGKAFLDMLGVFAEFETNLRKERQAEGIAAAKARGVSTAESIFGFRPL